MSSDVPELTIVGGGLAGSEAAWQAAELGIPVNLYEMRPQQVTPAHMTDQLAELVCSNSLGSDLVDRAPGLLKAELRRMGSFIMRCADESKVPAGRALAVDREGFAHLVTERIENHPNITLIREEVKAVPHGPTIITSGPLTSSALADDLIKLTGEEHLYFYDALSPIVAADSIDMHIAFRASRYDNGGEDGGDYINCPLHEDEYVQFVEALLRAETIELRSFEREDPNFFEGCLPIEVLAKRGRDSLAYGPMRPVGLLDPRTDARPHAVVQLRQDNLAGTLYNIVGFQTNVRWGAQAEILRMIPGLKNAEFIRYGQMHRNTFINSPRLLRATAQFHTRDDLFFAGQLIGVEGYIGNAGTGLLAGINAARLLMGQPLWTLPLDTMLGALMHYAANASPANFQPMKANFGLLPPHEQRIKKKRERQQAHAQRALASLDAYLASIADSVSVGN